MQAGAAGGRSRGSATAPRGSSSSLASRLSVQASKRACVSTHLEKKFEAARRACDLLYKPPRFKAGLRTRAMWVDPAVERGITRDAREDRISLAFALDAAARTQEEVEVGAGGHAAKEHHQ